MLLGARSSGVTTRAAPCASSQHRPGLEADAQPGLSPSVEGTPASRCDFWRAQAHLASNHCLQETGLGEGERLCKELSGRQSPRDHTTHTGEDASGR